MTTLTRIIDLCQKPTVGYSDHYDYDDDDDDDGDDGGGDDASDDDDGDDDDDFRDYDSGVCDYADL